MFRFIILIINLIVPGAGLAALGHLRWAILVQLFLLLNVLILCWSRSVFSPLGIQISLGIIALSYAISSGWCLVAFSRGPRNYWIQTIVFACLSLIVFSTGFAFKHHLLGVQVFFVPSMSMHPTLKPGQFILVDSWAYKITEPQEKDIVVFMSDDINQWLVKRIATWPDGNLQQNSLWYLLGDNPGQSGDSRYFGGVKSHSIIGKVELVLVEIDRDKLPINRSFLTKPGHY